ncbi:hypothetical protein Tco_1345001 [Tanacetum coccineum]
MFLEPPAPEKPNGSPSTIVIHKALPAVYWKALLPHQNTSTIHSDSDVETLDTITVDSKVYLTPYNSPETIQKHLPTNSVITNVYSQQPITSRVSKVDSHKHICMNRHHCGGKPYSIPAGLRLCRKKFMSLNSLDILRKSFAPCARLEAIRLFIAHAANPEQPSHVYRLKKAHYWHKQAPRAWLSLTAIAPYSYKADLSIPSRNHFTWSLWYNGRGCDYQGVPIGCHDTRRSTSGSAQFLGHRLVSWSSKKQKSTAISTTEAEYIALSGCCAQILWMRSQLRDYGFAFNKIPMYCDNQSAIALCCNSVQHSRSKHIDIRHHFIKE